MTSRRQERFTARSGTARRDENPLLADNLLSSKEKSMAARISAIYRYPVKGLSAEALDRVALDIGQCLPNDRRFAIALGTTEFDAAHPTHLSKKHFIMLMRDACLARLSTRFDAESGVLTIAVGGRTRVEASLGEPEGQRRCAAFFDEFMGGAVPGPLRVVEAKGHAFADAGPKPNATTDKYVSLINLASLRDFEDKIGTPLDRLRFRANVYFDGVPAWDEQGWMERGLTVGGARLRVIWPITRCAATEVNPATAERDVPVVTKLMRHYGHNIMGVYAEVVGAGTIAVGDPIATV
jgi:uncharacterized protein YcbX